MEKKLLTFFIFAFLVVTCGEVRQTPEEEIRQKLGIPEKAEKVLIIGQSSHLDVDWLTSFDNYYEHFVKDIFLSALDFLKISPVHYYSIAEMAFIKRFVEDNPEGRGEELLQRIREGRFVILGGGFSSPDNLLPDGEAIIMNYLKGLKWLRNATGKYVRPLSVWLPDDFGHSPSLPDLLSSMGFRYVGFARTDGMDTTVNEITGERVLREGSTAKTLMDDGSADFIWKGKGGEIIGHWTPFSLYCQGDTIDFIGQPLPGGFLGLYMGYDEGFTNSRIEEFINQLERVSPTPYMFLPIGCDFTFPKKFLYKYAERWNREKFKKTGVWVAVGNFEDYMKLVEIHKDKLNEYQFDMNPYFTGFYSSRPYLKQLFYKAEMEAIALEALLAFKGKRRAEMDEIWEKIGFATHHDFITGTSPRQVEEKEQIPLLMEVIEKVESLGYEELSELSEGSENYLTVFNPFPQPKDAFVEVKVNRWVFQSDFVKVGDKGHGWFEGGILYLELKGVPPFGITSFPLEVSEVSVPFSVAESEREITLYTPFYEAHFLKTPTFYLWELKRNGKTLLKETGILTSYKDEGGLWRIGSEMEGCSFEESVSAPAFSEIRYYLTPITAIVEGTVILEGETIRVSWVFFRSLPWVELRVKGKAPLWRTVTVEISSPVRNSSAFTSVPHGIRSVVPVRHFIPTFWSTNGGAFVEGSEGGYVLIFNRPGGVKWNGKGGIEFVVFRNAPRERCESLGTVTEKTGQTQFVHTAKIKIFFLNGTEDEESLFGIMRKVQVPLISTFGKFVENNSFTDVEKCVPLIVKMREEGEEVLMRTLDLDGSGCDFKSDVYEVLDEKFNSLEEYSERGENNVIKNLILRKK